jgi:L-ribulokinase
MMKNKYVIGLDYGTESCRALLVDAESGTELAQAVYQYEHGVIDEVLPESDCRLEKDWALQDPADYLKGLKLIPEVLKRANVPGEAVAGIGIDFTACTILPTLRDGTPLCFSDELRGNPHAWPKLWKHHAAQAEADLINQLARERDEKFLSFFGGKVSSEWSLPKLLQILHESPEIYRAAARFIEAGDWLVWRLTGNETRNTCAAGYKGFWNHRDGYPGRDFLAALHPDFAMAAEAKLQGPLVAPGQKAGTLRPELAKELGLTAGTAVSAATIDAHAGVPGCGVAGPDQMVMIMGTSSCQMVMTESPHYFQGFAGLVKDGILPGLYGYEYGQSAVGDIFAWFIENALPYSYHEEAVRRGIGIFTLLEEKARLLGPGSNGLVALDWFNGNRSTLMNANLQGVITGFTLKTKPEGIYRALIEATAFGVRKIIDTHEAGACPLTELFACGGLTKDRLLMQIYADVLGKPVKVAASSQPVALGAAIFGALAAGNAGGGYESAAEAVHNMVPVPIQTYHPDCVAAEQYRTVYQRYLKLYDDFGRAGSR